MDIYNQEENKQAVVYWIHLKEHTDIFTEGYVGVSTDYNIRFINHRSELKCNKHDNIHFQRAYNLYGKENFIWDILLYGEQDFCYKIEEKLRPIKYIGWSINKGGTKPPSPKGRIKTQEEIEKTRAKNIALNRKCTEEQKQNHSERMKGRKLKPESILKREQTKIKNGTTNKGRKTPKHENDKRIKTFQTNLRKQEKYIVIWPDGHEEKIGNLKEFCRINNIKYDSMNRVALGKQSHHKGFIVKKIIPPNL